MKKVTLILLSLTITLTAGWWRTYGGAEDDGGKCVEETYDSGYIVTGIPWLLLKLDKRGNVLWKKDYDFGGCCIHQTSDSGYIVSGGNRVLKTDEFGDTEWMRNFGWTISWVEQTSDKGYILTGTRTRFFEPWTNELIHLEKLDQGGNKVWSRTFGEDGWDFHSHGYFVQQTSTGGYIITGATDNYGPGGWLIRTNYNGEIDWDYIISDTYFNQTREIHDGSFLSVGNGNLLKTDSSGNILWQRSPEEGYDYGHSFQLIDGNCLIFTGSSNGDLFLMKCDSIGDTIWARKYGGDEDDYGRYVQKTSDGGYIVVGSTESFGAGKSDIYLIKTDSLGLLAVEEPVTPETQDWQVLVPVGREIVLMFNESSPPLTLTVFDALGRQVDELHVPQTGGTITWGEGYGAGVYFIKTAEGQGPAQKVVLVR